MTAIFARTAPFQDRGLRTWSGYAGLIAPDWRHPLLGKTVQEEC